MLEQIGGDTIKIDYMISLSVTCKLHSYTIWFELDLIWCGI